MWPVIFETFFEKNRISIFKRRATTLSNVFPVGWKLLLYFSFGFVSVMLALLFKLTVFCILILAVAEWLERWFSAYESDFQYHYDRFVKEITSWWYQPEETILVCRKCPKKHITGFPWTFAWNVVDETVWEPSLGLYWHEVTNNHHEGFEHTGFVQTGYHTRLCLLRNYN